MKRLLSVLLLGSGLWAPVSGAERPNVLLICIDDLRPELKCFGADYIHSPHTSDEHSSELQSQA